MSDVELREPGPPFANLDFTDPSELLYAAWQVIASAGFHQGGWEAEHPDWVEAAKAWRDAWHKYLADRPDMQPVPGQAPEGGVRS